MTYSSVAVDRDGNWLEYRGDKDFTWYLGLIGMHGHDHLTIIACVFRCGYNQSRLNLVSNTLESISITADYSKKMSLDCNNLEHQLKTISIQLKDEEESLSIFRVLQFLQSLSEPARSLFSQTVTLVELILFMQQQMLLVNDLSVPLGELRAT